MMADTITVLLVGVLIGAILGIACVRYGMTLYSRIHESCEMGRALNEEARQPQTEWEQDEVQLKDEIL